MKIRLTFSEGTGVCARQGLKRIDLDFPGSTLGALLTFLPLALGPELTKELKDPALQLILRGRIFTTPFDPELPMQSEDHLYFLKALDGG
jgi:hypothetical protein